MKLIADEDIEAAVIARLRTEGHEVFAVREEQSAGGEDLSVLANAVAEHVLLLTADRDFGDLIFRDHLPTPSEGIVLHRLPTAMPSVQKAAIIAEAFTSYADRFAGHFTVIEEQNVRLRPLPNSN